MTTNRDWLFSLPLEEQYAWMNAEHTKSPTSETMQHIGQVIENTIKRGVYGDTAAENADSRDKLEADIRDTVPEWHVDTIIGWLDRQAAITSHQWESYHNGMMREWMAKTVELQEQVDELTAERDEWKSRLETGKAQFDAILAERELYREALSQLLDTVTEGMGKVSALLDNYDEGMA